MTNEQNKGTNEAVAEKGIRATIVEIKQLGESRKVTRDQETIAVQALMEPGFALLLIAP